MDNDHAWVEIMYQMPGDIAEFFVARVTRDYETSILKAPDDTFIRFEFVRRIDDDGAPELMEDDDEVGTDHYFFLRKSTIIRLDPVRGEYVAKWDATLPDFA